LFSGSNCTAVSDHSPSTSDNNFLVLFTVMSLSPLEVINRHAIDSSRLFAPPVPECGATILPGSAMKETIRAFLLGMLILLTALIPPTILLVEYFRR
jgi:hypothetical protein